MALNPDSMGDCTMAFTGATCGAARGLQVQTRGVCAVPQADGVGAVASDAATTSLGAACSAAVCSSAAAVCCSAAAVCSSLCAGATRSPSPVAGGDRLACREAAAASSWASAWAACGHGELPEIARGTAGSSERQRICGLAEAAVEWTAPRRLKDVRASPGGVKERRFHAAAVRRALLPRGVQTVPLGAAWGDLLAAAPPAFVGASAEIMGAEVPTWGDMGGDVFVRPGIAKVRHAPWVRGPYLLWGPCGLRGAVRCGDPMCCGPATICGDPMGCCVSMDWRSHGR